MVNRDLRGVVRGGPERRGGEDFSKCWVLVVKEKETDEVVKIHLANMPPKCLKRGTWILLGWIEGVSTAVNIRK